MTSNFKVLGLALVAVLAISAMVASAASGAEFTASSGKGTTITASDTGNVKFTVTGQELWCEEVSYTGTAPGASFASVTVNAVYNKCRTAIINPVPITGFGAGGCDYVFHANGTLDMVCPEGKDVTVDDGPCVLHIPGQKGLGTITYTNNAAGDIDIDLNLTKVTSTHTDGFLCVFGSSGHNAESVLENSAALPLTATASAGTFTWDK